MNRNVLWTKGHKVLSFEVFTDGEGESVNMLGQIGFIKYFEDVVDPSLHVDITIFDTNGLINKLPIRSGSVVKLQLTHPSQEDPFQLSLIVTNISGHIIDNKREIYTLTCETKGALSNHTNRVWKKYTGSIAASVSTIINEKIEGEINEVDTTSNELEFYGNYRRPFKVISDLCRKAIPSTSGSSKIGNEGTAGYLFYETKDGYNFRSIDVIFKSDTELETSAESHKPILHGVSGRIIKARTLNQRKIIDSVTKNDMVFAIGPAGTGKTYTGIALAVKALKNKNVKRIILTRPAIEAGENLGFLPGDLKEKLDPYMQPLYDSLKDMIPSEKLKKYMEDEVIQIAPLAFMRGRTLDNAFVILDEGQNTTHSQMKMFLTRMGKNAKFIITGDPGQVDLKRNAISGIKEAILILKNTPGVGIVHLDESDVIRNKLVKKIVHAYKNIENNS